jgi:CRISPR-associated endoribonuclease Cas6
MGVLLRLLIKISTDSRVNIPVNYNYPLSSAIYNLLRFGSPEFSSFLHDIGFSLNGKKYKLFSFALRFEKMKISENEIKMLEPDAYLFVSSPLIDEFIQNFVIGTFGKQEIEIYGNHKNAVFSISQVETIAEPKINCSQSFRLLSPLVLSTKREYNGQLKQYYLRPDDQPELNKILTQNLKNKYELIHKKKIDAEDLLLEWDKDYLEKKKRVTKKITIDENSKHPIDIIGIQAPFMLKGNPGLIKVGYECGFGEKNSMGFGLADTDFTDLH